MKQGVPRGPVAHALQPLHEPHTSTTSRSVTRFICRRLHGYGHRHRHRSNLVDTHRIPEPILGEATLFSPWTKEVNTVLDIRISGNTLPTTKYSKLLGVTFDTLWSPQLFPTR